MTAAVDHATEVISLIDSIERDQHGQRQWLKILLPVVRDAGPAAQTLAGILNITYRETFRTHQVIADHAYSPISTVRKHLKILQKKGWLENDGRGRTRGGSPRRTCTLKITNRTRDAMKAPADEANTKSRILYGVLPWWACTDVSPLESPPRRQLPRRERALAKNRRSANPLGLENLTENMRRTEYFSWAERAVLSLVMARVMTLKGALEKSDAIISANGDMASSIGNMGGSDRFEFTLKTIQELTGLSHQTVIDAKRALANAGVIRCSAKPPGQCDNGTPRQILEPNWTFKILVEQDGRWRFDPGSNIGH